MVAILVLLVTKRDPKWVVNAYINTHVGGPMTSVKLVYTMNRVWINSTLRHLPRKVICGGHFSVIGQHKGP